MKNSITLHPPSIGIVLLLALFLTACDNSSNSWKTVAPTNADETGYIIHGASHEEISTFLLENSNAQARKVSQAHQIYEIYSTSEKTLNMNFPGADIYKNEFYPLQKKKKITIKSLNKAYKIFAETSQDATNPFATCKKSEEAPSPQITIDFPKLELADGTMDLGGFFSLSSVTSTAHQSHISQLKKTWYIVPPRNSAYKTSFVEGDLLNYKPDTVGSYQLGLVVQDARNVCAVSRGMITVSHNPGFKGATGDLASLRSKHNLAAFKHLTEVQAEKAWAYSEGQGVVIAIIDTGVNYNHPALAHNILVNPGEIAENGIDDDGNGYIDDSYGYDFANLDSDPYDDQGHGSHVAGLAASGVFGLARQAYILPIKALSPAGGDPASIAAAVFYAVDRGAHVINMSLGGGSAPHPMMIKAMAYAEAQNVVVIAAAGNGDENGNPVNIDQSPIYPASLTNKNLISVAAKDSVGLLAPYSNFGVTSVDVVAPGGGYTQGDQIYSCTTINPTMAPYVGLQGTSMAAPIVAGIAAQVLALNPKLKPQQIRSILMSAGTRVPALKSLIGSSRYLNALTAVTKTSYTLSFF